MKVYEAPVLGGYSETWDWFSNDDIGQVVITCKLILQT